MHIEEAANRLEIAQQLTNYATAIDSGDWELYRHVFTPDADIDYTNSIPVRGTPDQIIESFEPVFDGVPWAQHYITNISCKFEVDSCSVRAFFYNPCQIAGFEGVSHHYGYYDHEFVRTSDGWKSMKMVETMLNSINPASPGLPVVSAVRS